MMNVEDFLAALKRLENHEKRYAAIEAALQEQSAQFADILELLTKMVERKPGAEKATDFGPLVEAIRGIQIRMPDMPVLPAPKPANDWTRLNISIPQGEGMPARVMTITKGK